MEKQYIICARYQMWTRNGIEWSSDFVMKDVPMSESIAKDTIKNFKQTFDYIDKKTKLKHEYFLKEYNEYLKEFQRQMDENDILKKQQDEYFKSDKYKELQKKKRQSAKERKEKQLRYLQEHEKI